jgi:hypothetical protein
LGKFRPFPITTLLFLLATRLFFIAAHLFVVSAQIGTTGQNRPKRSSKKWEIGAFWRSFDFAGWRRSFIWTTTAAAT